MSFVCPRCGAESFNLNDIAQRYCGRCHVFVDEPEPNMRTWDEHLAFCKERALAYVDRGELAEAVASMAGDIQTHPETKLNETAMAFLTGAALQLVLAHDTRGVRRWVEGFN